MRATDLTLSGTESGASIPDAELVLSCRGGDKRAFVAIVARYQAMVAGITLGLLGNFTASEDAAQETFLTAWQKLDTLRDPAHLRAWLGQIARNTALLQLRRRHDSLPLEETLPLAEPEAPPDETAIQKEEAKLVSQTLSRLPETYRLPLILYYREDQSVRAVAQSLGVSEDAIKQRLARGREMLREQMSGLVEKVLKRTRPKTVFTIAVAAALGALAAPEAVAGTVFTSASATAGSSNSSSVWLLSVMNTSKAVLLTAAALALVCIPIGYEFQKATETNPSAKLATTVRPDQTGADLAELQRSDLFIEWQQLHQRYGTNAEAMPLLAKAIEEMKIPFRQRAFHAALIAEWAQVDPQGGLKHFFTEGQNKNDQRQFFEEWFRQNPVAAATALPKAGKGWEETATECLTAIAQRAPAQIPEMVAKLPLGEEGNAPKGAVREAFSILAQKDLENTRSNADALSGPYRTEALAGIAQSWAKVDFGKTLAWARSLANESERNEAIRGALVGRAAIAPTEALDQVELVPAGGQYYRFGSTTGARVLNEAATADLEGTIGWLVNHPGQMRAEDLQGGLVKTLTEQLNADARGFLNAHSSPQVLDTLAPALDNALLNQAAGQRAEVLDWLKTQPESPSVSLLRRFTLTTMAFQAPAEALTELNDLPASLQTDSLTHQVLLCTLNGGSSLFRFEQLYSQSPEKLREPYLEAAFEALNSENIEEPQKWTQRLSLLSSTAQPKASESLARAWAYQAPEEASQWVTSLPPGESRNQGLAAVASAWASSDMEGAVEWVNSISAGEEKDSALGALATALASRDPSQAWKWALRIGNDSERAKAAKQVLKAEAAYDPETARQWVQSGAFAPAARLQLEQVIAQAAYSPEF